MCCILTLWMWVWQSAQPHRLECEKSGFWHNFHLSQTEQSHRTCRTGNFTSPCWNQEQQHKLPADHLLLLPLVLLFSVQFHIISAHPACVCMHRSNSDLLRGTKGRNCKLEHCLEGHLDWNLPGLKYLLIGWLLQISQVKIIADHTGKSIIYFG